MYKEAKKSLKAAGGTDKWRELCDRLYDSAGTVTLSPLLLNNDNHDKQVPLEPHTPPAAAEAEVEAETEAAETQAAATEAEAAATEAAATEAAATEAEAAATKAVAVAAAAAAAAAAEAKALSEAAADAGGGTGVKGIKPSSLPFAKDSLKSLQQEERVRWDRFAAGLSGANSSGGMPPPALSTGLGLLPTSDVTTLQSLLPAQLLSAPSMPAPSLSVQSLSAPSLPAPSLPALSLAGSDTEASRQGSASRGSPTASSLPAPSLPALSLAGSDTEASRQDSASRGSPPASSLPVLSLPVPSLAGSDTEASKQYRASRGSPLNRGGSVASSWWDNKFGLATGTGAMVAPSLHYTCIAATTQL
jgi:hypothetical protein